MRRITPILVAVLVLVATACGDDDTGTGTDRRTGADTEAAAGAVRLLTHESFLVSDATLETFTAETGITVEIIRAGDAGQVVNQAVLTAGNPVADVVFGIDTTFLSRALDGNVLVPYESPGLARVDPALVTDPRVTPVSFGDVCLNYDRAAFTDLPPPETLQDLTDPSYRGMLVVEDPATSSPGLAFLLATIAVFGEEGDYTWRDYWTDLEGNDIEVAAGWEEAYYTFFSGSGGGGARPVVVSYASSPPAEVIYAETPLDEAPTAVITDGCFRQVEYAGILRGTAREDEARSLIDFMLSGTYQEDVPLNMFVFPAVTGTPLPPEFVEHTVIPEDPAGLDPAAIEANRERWIEEWSAIVAG